MMDHLSEEQFVLYYYGEGDDAAGVREHLDACEACRRGYAGLQRVLNTVNAAPVPDRAANYGAQVWRQLEPKLGARGRFGSRWLAPLRWPTRHWAAAASMAALVVAAFLAGRYYPKPQPVSQMASAGQVRERILLVAVGDHLERSQMVLVELVNAHPGEELDISSEQERAGDLLAENRLYRQTAARSGDTRLAGVLDELEPVLLEIAHGPAHLSPQEADKLRGRIESDGILFKVQVVGSTARHRGERISASPGQKSL
jgi:anti-sigma factor RsiW